MQVGGFELHNFALKLGVRQKSFDLFNLPATYLSCFACYLYCLVHMVYIISYSSEFINSVLYIFYSWYEIDWWDKDNLSAWQMKLFSFYRALGGPRIKVTYKSKEHKQKSILGSHTGKIHVHVPKVIIIIPASNRMTFSTWILFPRIAVQHLVLISNFTGLRISLFFKAYVSI